MSGSAKRGRVRRLVMETELFILAIAGRVGVGPFAHRRSGPLPGPWRHLWIVAALLGILAWAAVGGGRP